MNQNFNHSKEVYIKFQASDYIKCNVETCNKSIHGLGYCSKHYKQFKKHGKTFISTQHDFNEIIDKGSYYELILTNKSIEEVGRAKVDKEDLEKLKLIGRWYLDGGGYVLSSNRAKTTHMHRVIMDAQADEYVDHKNTGIKHRSDNRKKNLRVCTKSQNNSNVSLRKDNKTGYKGVTKEKTGFRAQITLNKKKIYLGTFKSAKEAYDAYCKASIKYKGSFHNGG